MNERFVVYIVVGTLLIPMVHGTGPHDQVNANPVYAPHQYHVEVSSSAQPLIAPVVTNVGSGPNYRIEVDAAQLAITGHAPNLILSG